MGCRFSSVKSKPNTAPPPKSSLKTNKPPAAVEPAAERHSLKENPHASPDETPEGTSPHSPIKHPYANELAATDENALEDDISNNYSPNGTRRVEPPVEEDAEENDDDDENGGGSGMDLNGSFANVDLNGSFHIHYNTKGDIIPNATLPEGRRGRSVSPKLLAALSPHPSDDELVLVCTDCGMTIDENCEPMCSLTGKLHV